MITPVFWITQSDQEISIRIRAPYSKLSEVDIDYGDFQFLFSCAPYFLRLTFNQRLEFYGETPAKMTFDSDSGEFTICVPKKVVGEEFTGLDLISNLLRPKSEVHARELVQEVEGTSDDEEEEGDLGGDEFYVEQNVQDIEHGIQIREKNIKCYGYGFGWRRIGVVEQLAEELSELEPLKKSIGVKIDEREAEGRKIDQDEFDVEHYLGDALEPDDQLIQSMRADFGLKLDLTNEDRERLKDMSNKKFLRLGQEMNKKAAISLVDIVFAYAYDLRVSDWESSCESGWTITRLSPTLGQLSRFEDVKSGLTAAVRKSLCLPLYRSYDLSMRVVEDVKKIFDAGQTALLHVLCDVHRILATSGGFRYIFNDLFITDYCLWIQSVDVPVLDWIREEVQNVQTITKGEIFVDLDLDVLELDFKMHITSVDSDDEA